jgi:Cu/Ag efflux protein CusF
MGLKRVLGMVFALLAVAAFSLTAVAQEKGKAEGAKMEEKKADAGKGEAKTMAAVRGATVKSVDAAGKTLTVTTKAKKDVVVSVDDKTKVRAGREQKKFEDLKEGDRVNVTSSSAEGKTVAKVITVLPAPKPKMEAKPKGEEKPKMEGKPKG